MSNATPKQKIVEELMLKEKLFQKIFPFGRFLWYLFFLIKNDLKSTVRVNVFKKIWLWRRGFTAESSVIYSLDNSSLSDYLSDYTRSLKTPFINGEFSIVLNNKLIFARLLYKYGCHIPEIYCLINQGVVIPTSDKRLINEVDDIVNLCLEVGALVIKPVSGSIGEDVFFIRSIDEKMFINDTETAPSGVKTFLSRLDNYIVNEYVRQHSYASEIFPYSTNTIRLLTMWDYDLPVPFIAVAVHRFGRNSSIPVDNWVQGGLSTLIDQETGKLGNSTSSPADSKLIWFQNHPDTNSRIEGVIIPHWATVKTRILEMAAEIPFVPYIGWDAVITDDGFKVIEGNNHSGVNHLQVHYPLLSNPRIKKFYSSVIG